MEFPCKLEFALPSLSRQDIIEPRASYLELRERDFTLLLRFRASQPQEKDDSLPWEEVDSDFELVGKRTAVTAVEKMWIQDEKRWRINIGMKGTARDIQLYFKKQVECEPIYHQLINYFFNNNPT